MCTSKLGKKKSLSVLYMCRPQRRGSFTAKILKQAIQSLFSHFFLLQIVLELVILLKVLDSFTAVFEVKYKPKLFKWSELHCIYKTYLGYGSNCRLRWSLTICIKAKRLVSSHLQWSPLPHCFTTILSI